MVVSAGILVVYLCLRLACSVGFHLTADSVREVVVEAFPVEGEVAGVAFDKLLTRRDKFILGEVRRFIAFNPDVSVEDVDVFLVELIAGVRPSPGVVVCGYAD